MKKTATTPNENFNKAMNLFFGSNPANPYWFLFVLYLRKKHLLSIENNYPGDSANTLTPFNEPTYWEDVIGYKFPKGVLWRSVVGKIEGNQRLIDIYREFERASKSREQATLESSLSFIPYQWEDMFLLETVSLLLSIDDDWFNNNFNDCFDKAMNRIFAKERFELYTQPKELTELIGHLIGDDVKVIYNPFAGIGNFPLLTPNTAKYIGEEIVPIIANIANLRILANEINGEVKVTDSINDYDYFADIIVSNPPMRYKIDNPDINCIYGGLNDADTLLLRKCAKRGLRGIILVPIAMSFGDSYSRSMREFLIKRDCVYMIIELPSNILGGTSIASAIYVLNPNHTHKGKVRIINASECFTKNSANRILDVCQIVSIVDSANSKKSIDVELQTITDNNYSFMFSHYAEPDVKLPNSASLMQISDLGECIYNHAYNYQKKGKFADFSILSNPNKLKIFTPEDFAERDFKKPSCQIEQDCLIVQLIRGIRAAYVKTFGETLYMPNRYISFVPNENIVLPLYLVLQIHSDYVQKQVGEVTTSHNEFQKLKIVVPTLDEQRKAIEEYKAQLIDDLGVEIDSLKNKRYNEFERNMHLRKHHLKHVLSEIVPAARLMADFISSQEGNFSKNEIVGKRTHTTLENYAFKLLHNTKKIQGLISALTDEESFNDPEIIDIADFIHDYKERKIDNDDYDLVFRYEPIINDELENNPDFDMSQSPNLTAYIARSSFETIFDNIISNAKQHGFTEEERKDYTVRVLFCNVVVDGTEMLEIRISNNGEKIPVGMATDQIFSWGVGTGTGLGSWQTKNIVEHFGGSIEFIQNDDAADGFYIEYRILLPITD